MNKFSGKGHGGSEPLLEDVAQSATPNLAGNWDMEIHWHREGKEGRVSATATIHQDKGEISMEVYSEGSDSHTLLAQFQPEARGSSVLYYMYEVEPKALKSDAGGPYKGAAVLRFYPQDTEIRGNYWTDKLTRGHFKLHRKRDTQRKFSMNESVEVVLIAAIKEEFEAAKEAFSAQTDEADGVREWTSLEGFAGAQCLSGTFFLGGHSVFGIALARPTRMGANRTGPVATMLAQTLQPRCLVMCGVCAGNPGDLALGDVVVSELAYQYDEGKIEAGGFVGDHRQSPVARDWLLASQALDPKSVPSYGDPSEQEARFWILECLYTGKDPRNHTARERYFKANGWRTTIEALEAEGLVEFAGPCLSLTASGAAAVERSIVVNVDPPAKLPLAIMVGPIASGNVVVKDGLTWDRLKQMGVRSVLGLDMEAAVIAEVAQACEIENWIVIKGVMDHADPNKNDRFKPFAARASAEVLRALLIDRLGGKTQ
jgi:nucleoside phosphorylase